MNSGGLVVADLDAGIGHQPVGGGDHVACAQRSVERQIDRREAGGIAAVAGAVGAQRLSIGKGVFAVGITLAGRARGAVDVAAEEDLGRAGRTKGLAHLDRRSVAARQRKILAVAASHAKSGTAAGGTGRGAGAGAGSAGKGRRRNSPAAAAPGAAAVSGAPPKKKSNRPSADASRGARTAPARRTAATGIMRRRIALKGQLCTQRLLHPTPGY